MNIRASETFGLQREGAAETIPALDGQIGRVDGPGDAAPAARDWSPVLDRLKLSEQRRRRIAALAKLHGTSFRTELLAADFIDERHVNGALADELGIAQLDRIDAASLVMRDADCLALLGRQGGSHPAMIRGLDGDTALVISPDRAGPRGLARLLARAPHLRKRIRAASAIEIRRALLERARDVLALRAVHGLASRFPDLSARIVASFWQGLVVGVGIVGLPGGLWLVPNVTIAALHACFSFFFLACVSLRFAALKDAAPLTRTPIRAFQPADLPTYSVLVALYKEAEIVPELLVALGKLQWPRSKLEIKLVCEADDHQTLAAIRTQPLKPFVEIIEVPPSLPRTKPKALTYALPATCGEFVVLYDAEDRPHPEQLLEAWQTFRSTGPNLACLQAPLDIANSHAGSISRMFAFEYSALFRGMLPFLARNDLLLPLGGTSNHFRGIM
ncbi:MAG TPA: glycosyltransferase [Rhizobiaceae bacterium]|nr:glycosyltransferase [Rhizobiaceae bacterium]